MGLLELLQQGQTQLSAGSFPGDTPINDPQSGFVQENSPNNTYEDEVIGTPNNGSVLINTLDNTALDNTNPLFDTPTLPPSTNNNYPPLASGEFNGAPSQYEPLYSANNTYLDSIEDINETPQVNTLEQTGLDNSNLSSAQTSTTPNTVSLPNNYPELVSGEFNGAPSQYLSPYNSNNTYLDVISIQDPNSPQNFSLANTGLDNTNPSAAPSAIVPNDTSYPNNYPSLVSGEFNGAPSQYTSPYNSEDTYLDSISIQDPNSPQIPTLGETGLDLDNSEYSPTATQPSSIAYPNNYPAIEGVNLGGFGGPEQYDTNWNQDNTYLNSFNQDSENSIQLGFTGSNLDNSSAGVSTLSHVIPPSSVYKPVVYPIIPQVNLGEFNAAPSQYVTPYNSTNTYLDQYDELKDVNTNPQTNTLDETALDVENPNSLPTSLIYAPTNPDDITTYPVITGINLGVTGSGAKAFNQIYKPSNTYWDSYKNNRSLFDTLSV